MNPSMGTILVVEDDPDHRFLLAERLPAAFPDLRILLTDSGEAALQLAQRTQPDIVVLDLHLRGIEGFELASRLRGLAPSVPIVILTADTSEESMRRAREQAFSAFLVKPDGLRQLPDVLRALLQPVA